MTYPKHTTVLHIAGTEVFLNHDERQALLTALAVVTPKQVEDVSCTQYATALHTLKAKVCEAALLLC